jgi:hypothetical protein
MSWHDISTVVEPTSLSLHKHHLILSRQSPEVLKTCTKFTVELLETACNVKLSVPCTYDSNLYYLNRRTPWPHACWDRGFESYRGMDICLLYSVCVVR